MDTPNLLHELDGESRWSLLKGLLRLALAPGHPPLLFEHASPELRLYLKSKLFFRLAWLFFLACSSAIWCLDNLTCMQSHYQPVLGNDLTSPAKQKLCSIISGNRLTTR